jgi:hypothetical protein
LPIPKPVCWQIAHHDGTSSDDPRTKEGVIGFVDALEDHQVILDSDPIAEGTVVLYELAATDVAVTADARTGQHVGERPNLSPMPNLVAFAQSMRMHDDTVQWQ